MKILTIILLGLITAAINAEDSDLIPVDPHINVVNAGETFVLPIDGKKHIVIVTDRTNEYQWALIQAQINLAVALKSGKATDSQIKQLSDLILSKLTPFERKLVEDDVNHLLEIEHRKEMLERGPFWMHKGREIK
jgi:hypothetical protein